MDLDNPPARGEATHFQMKELNLPVQDIDSTNSLPHVEDFHDE